MRRACCHRELHTQALQLNRESGNRSIIITGCIGVDISAITQDTDHFSCCYRYITFVVAENIGGGTFPVNFITAILIGPDEAVVGTLNEVITKSVGAVNQ